MQMYSSAVPSPPQAWQQIGNPGERRIDAALSPTSPTTTTGRTGRLRGLSYLRNYSNRHSSSNTQNQTPSRPLSLGRATSYPSPTSRSAAPSASPPAPLLSPQQTPPPAQAVTSQPLGARSNTQANSGSTNTSGWLPSVGGQSGVSRIAAEPQPAATASTTSAPLNTTPAAETEATASMARTRSATMGVAADTTPQANSSEPQTESRAVSGDGIADPPAAGMAHQLPSIRFTAHQDPRAQRPSLVFTPALRILPSGREIIKVGRYSEREHPAFGNDRRVPSAAPVGFKSKVVSRRHCEFWFSAGVWYIKDVKSSSGTFLNHIRLSSPGSESKPFPVKDGDIVQLGIDFKGGEEMIFRCVKIRVELNKDWRNGPTQFNVQSHKLLRELNAPLKPGQAGSSSQDCSICLGPIAPCQPLFVAPCSHTWHYKCIRVIINGPHWPHFICPNCRSVADLEADLDDPSEWEQVDTEEANGAAQTEGPQTQQAPEAAATSIEPATIRREMDSTGATTTGPQEIQPGAENTGDDDLVLGDDHSSNSESGVAAEQLGYLHLEDSPSPSLTPEPHTSSATVAPVDIISRRPVAAPSSDRATLLEDPAVRERNARTPSPNGLGSDLHEATSGHEGPMTPRNDVGPFVFDGTAGRTSTSAERGRGVAVNLDAAASAGTPVLQ